MESDMDDVRAIAEEINEILETWGLEHQLAAHPAWDRAGVAYILLVDGGRPAIYLAPQHVLGVLERRRARGRLTAPDLWNILAAYRQEHLQCVQDAAGQWRLVP